MVVLFVFFLWSYGAAEFVFPSSDLYVCFLIVYGVFIRQLTIFAPQRLFKARPEKSKVGDVA